MQQRQAEFQQTAVESDLREVKTINCNDLRTRSSSLLDQVKTDPWKFSNQLAAYLLTAH